MTEKTKYETVKAELRARPKTWLITGVAGFIGSNLLEALLELDQRVVGLDSFVTGYQHNIDEVLEGAGEKRTLFHMIEGDICDVETCCRAMSYPDESNLAIPVDYVLHQAALGSVPRSIDDPARTNATNIDGFLNILIAARDAGVKRMVYAASSSTYGDHSDLPKVEDRIGRPLSPYAVTKYVNELYADVFARSYGFDSIGLRYFNIFGKRQDPNGAYAAVIPKWVAAMITGEPVYINGDGETSRDFCFISNAVQANLLATTSTDPYAANKVYNVAVGERTSLNSLFEALCGELMRRRFSLAELKPTYRDFRPGDVRHSLADISKATKLLGYAPTHRIHEGVGEAMDWYVKVLGKD